MSSLTPTNKMTPLKVSSEAIAKMNHASIADLATTLFRKNGAQQVGLTKAHLTLMANAVVSLPRDQATKVIGMTMKPRQRAHYYDAVKKNDRVLNAREHLREKLAQKNAGK